MDGDEPRYSDEQTVAALRRAAQLQLEAAARIERRTVKALTAGDSGQHARVDLIESAREVGIGEEFVTVALAELEAGKGSALVREATEEESKQAERWLGSRLRSISVSRVINAPGPEVLAAVVEVFESDDYRLKFIGNRGGAPLEGGLLEFQMERLMEMYRRRSNYTQLCYRLEQLEVWTLRTTLHPSGDRTEVVIYGDIRAGVRRNIQVARILTAVMSGTFGAVAGLMSAVTGAAALLAALGGVVTFAALMPVSVLAYRALYRSALAKTIAELEKMLEAVAIRLERAALLAGAGVQLPALPESTDNA